MEEATTIRLPQDRETPITVVRHPNYAYRYTYARSADSRVADDRGQDYLAIRDDGHRLAFALCDGVGQSFFGDLAARLLGDALLEWLWTDVAPQDGVLDVQAMLATVLQDLVAAVTEVVATFPLPDGLAPIVRSVLEQKRALGSESTFSAGLLDVRAGQCVLVWMGDSRIRLWGRHGEPSDELGDTFHTLERWSSRRGAVGQAHAFVAPLNDLQRLVIFSDGLAQIDNQFARSPTNRALETLITDANESPTSDDISFIEIQLGDLLDLKGPITMIQAWDDAGPEGERQHNIWKAPQVVAEPGFRSGRESHSSEEMMQQLPVRPPDSLELAAGGLGSPAPTQSSVRGRLRLLLVVLILMAIILGALAAALSGQWVYWPFSGSRSWIGAIPVVAGA